MVRIIARRLLLLAFAASLGAVGIGPKREGGRDERRNEAPRAPAPAPAPAAPAPAPAAPAPAAGRPRVGIAPRVMAPVERRPDASAPSPGFSPSAAGRGSPTGASRLGQQQFTPSSSAGVHIRRREGVETVPRRHYWHESRGRRYSHYYDGRAHWYGYPHGSSFFWLRPHAGFWWTWDSRFSRWSYWNDGFWWWAGPGGTQYVYVGDNYYPYDSVRRAAYAAPPAQAPDARGAWTSPDGRRLIEIAGPDADAILYDKSTSPPSYLRYLGNEVSKIRYSSAEPSSPPTILVEFRSGSFALFDYDGRRLDTAKPASVKAAPPSTDLPPSPQSSDSPSAPPPPDELPPPPR